MKRAINPSKLRVYLSLSLTLLAGCGNDGLQSTHKDERNSNTNLVQSIESGDLESLRSILEETPQLLEQKDTETNETPLFLASRLGHLEIIRYLLGKGADPHTQSKEKTIPEIILSHQLSNNLYHWYYHWSAIEKPDWTNDQWATEDQKQDESYWVSEEKDKTIFELFIDAGYDPNTFVSFGAPILILAIRADIENFSPALPYTLPLIRAGVNVQKIDESLGYQIISKGVINPPINQKRAYLYGPKALKAQHAETEFNLIDILEQKGMKLNHIDEEHGENNLHHAAKYFVNPLSFSLIADSGVDIDQVSSLWYKTPLAIAIDAKNEKATVALLDLGANPQFIDRYGNNLLHLNASNGSQSLSEEPLRRLVSEGVPINTENAHGKRPMDILIRKLKTDQNKEELDQVIEVYQSLGAMPSQREE